MAEEDWKFGYEKLLVWRKSEDFACEIYSATDAFPAAERFGLANQLRRAAVSVASNIAEGASRQSSKDQVRFVEIAYGSLMEVSCQLSIAARLKFISEESASVLRERCREISAMLTALRKSYLQKANYS